MKKNIIISLGFAVALVSVVNSCSKDSEFLKEDPKTIYVKENAFDKASQLDAALVRAYIKFDNMNTIAPLSFLFSEGFAGDVASNLLHGDGSDVLGGTRGESSAATGFNNYWALQSTNGEVLNVWTSLYQLASYANLVLDGMTLVKDLDPAQASYIEAQAKFFIGWSYLRLAECFGGVPIQREFSEELKFDYERATRAETYTYAIENLMAAVAGLPEKPAQNGRAGKGIANHFLAEAYLGRGIETGSTADYTAAVNAANAVISTHPIMTSRFGARALIGDMGNSNGVPNYRPDGTPYFDLFVKGNYSAASGNTESLMVFEQSEYATQSIYGGYQNAFAVTCGPAFRDLQWSEAKIAEHKAAGVDAGSPWMGPDFDQVNFPGGPLGIHLTGSWGIIGSTDYSDEDVWEGDLAVDDRNNQNVRYNPVVMTTSSPYYMQPVEKDWLAMPAALSRVSGKYTTFDLWGWDMEHCPMMAFGVYFCFQYGRDWYIARSAETYLLRAEAKLRGGDTAGALEDINTVRARANALPLEDADIYTILDERARELAWEEMRWPTLLRMGGNGSNEVMKTQLMHHSLGTEDVPMFAEQTFPEWTLFPIPFDVIALNTGAVIEQNPGYK